jgi:hypothetical protein
MAQIIFTDTTGVPEEFKPKPAVASVPDWYKNLESYMNGAKKPTGEGQTSATIKRCMPVFDAITNGYILYTYADVFVSQKPLVNQETGETSGKTIPWYEWPSYAPIQFHPDVQAPNHPQKGDMSEGGSYPKWINPWSIKTPPGYSVLFTQPMHRESPFTILDGIVDTDQYNAPVNFPFVLNDWSFEGLIPAGTPMAQVIPFKRDSWQMEIGTDTHRQDQSKTTRLLRTRFFDSYKAQFRQPKEYK